MDFYFYIINDLENGNYAHAGITTGKMVISEIIGKKMALSYKGQDIRQVIGLYDEAGKFVTMEVADILYLKGE